MKKYFTFSLRWSIHKLYLFLLTAALGLNNNSVAQISKSILFTRLSQSTVVQQGNTQSLTEYIFTSNNAPVYTSLNAVDGGKNVPSWLSVNGNLLNGISYTANSEISFVFDATNLSVGKYSAVITASAHGYKSAVLTLYVNVTSADIISSNTIKINFQDSSTVPADGWLKDYGQAFGLRTSAGQGSGNTYGWLKRADNTPLDLTKNGSKRTSPSDVLKATLIHMQANDISSPSLTHTEGIWQCKVANGNYKVTVCVGDGSAINSSHSINIEQVNAIANFVPSTSNRFKEVTSAVSVSDGYLTVDAKGGANTKINYIIIDPDKSSRPSVLSVNPENNALNINENSSVSTSILRLPNSGINNTTITTSNVYLTEDGTGLSVPSTVNGTGGGDAITLVPNASLKLNTTYRFTITGGVKDLTDSSFIPYSSTFTTGSVSTKEINDIKFDKIALPNTVGQHSSLTMGPDGKLYALTIDGIIQRYVINPDGTLQNPQLIYTLQDEYGTRQPRLAIGLTFDPSSTAGNLVAWVTHSTFVFTNGPDLDGKLSRLSGANLGNIQDIVVDLPRSKKDHLTNSIAFGPDGALYFSQASTSAMGRADNTWGNREEHLLSASCLRLDISKINIFPLDVKTHESGGTYNPYAANAPLTLYATGVRNAYDLLWHSNGELYMPTNGSAAGGNTPASVAGTLRPDGSHYNGPVVPALANVQETQNDYLFRIKKGGYYGHPNSTRGEYVLNGGNPASPEDIARVSTYPSGTLPDANYRGYAFNFQQNKSPDGVIEYKSNTFNGALKGKILVVRYSQNNDIITLTPGGPNKDIVSSIEGASIAGFSGFDDPLDLTEDTSNGNIYVSEYGDNGKISLLKPDNNISVQKADNSLTPVADAHVRAGNFANTNYGNDTGLVVKTSSSNGFSRKTYIKFSLNGIANAGNLTSAKLRVYGHNTESSAPINIAVFGVLNDSWIENGINWNNAPAASASALSSVAVNGELKYYEFDITNFVKQQAAGDKILSLLLRDTSNSNSKVLFNSRENPNFPPQLIISQDQVNAPPQRVAYVAVVTNTNLAKSRAVNTNVQAPLVRRSSINKIPACDEPADTYSEDTIPVLPVAIAPLASDSFNLVSMNIMKPTVYPNPLQNFFHIRFPAYYAGKYHMQMIDVEGRIYELGNAVLQSGGTDLKIDISKMSMKPGLYFLRIISDSKPTDVLKLIIQ